MIRVRNIDFAYGPETPILRDVSLDVRPGRITCLLGPSGCGKTTLLKLLAGVLAPTAGTIEADFRRPGPEVGYMQQSGGLLPWRTAFDNVALGLQLTRRPAEPEKIRAALRSVRLEALADALPRRLSGGQQQRVALAQQLVLRPKLLLLDEPLGPLDVVLRKELAGLIRDIVRDNAIAAVVVTHEPEDALFLGDDILIVSPRQHGVVRSWRAEEGAETRGYMQIVAALQEAAA